jgi:hypothetical protein
VNSGSMVEAGVKSRQTSKNAGAFCGAGKLQRSPSARLSAGFRFAPDDNSVAMAEIGEFQHGKARARRRFYAGGVDLHGERGAGIRAGECAGAGVVAGQCRHGEGSG